MGMSSRLNFGVLIEELIRSLDCILCFRSTSRVGTDILCLLVLPQCIIDVERLWYQLLVVRLPLCKYIVETVNGRHNKV